MESDSCSCSCNCVKRINKLLASFLIILLILTFMIPLFHSGFKIKNIKKEYAEYKMVLVVLTAHLFDLNLKERSVSVNNKRKFKRSINI